MPVKGEIPMEKSDEKKNGKENCAIAIFTTATSFYAPLTLFDLIKEKNNRIKIFVHNPVKKKGTLSKIIEKTGFEYFFLKAYFSVFLSANSFFNKLVYGKNIGKRKWFSLNELADYYGVQIEEVENVNERAFLERFRKLNPSIAVSCYFSQIFKEEFLGIPGACINIHPSLLPNYMGMSPVFWVLANNEKEAGFTIHFIDKGVDTGNIIRREKIEIIPGDSFHDLFCRISKKASIALLEAITAIESGNCAGTEQEGEKSYFSYPTKEAYARFKKNGFRLF